MERRTLICALGSGMAVLAGCSGRQDARPSGAGTAEPGNPTSEPRTTTGASTPERETERPAEERETEGATAPADDVRLLSIAAPDRVQLGESVGYRFTVENAGPASRTVDAAVESRTGSAAWTEHQRWEPVELAPGGRHTFESSTFTREYLETVEFRIADFSPTFAIEFAEKELAFAQGYRDPVGREIRVHGLSARSSYEYTSDGLRRVVELEEGFQFVFVDVEVVNRTDDPVEAPARGDFALLVDEESHHPITMVGDARYEAGELPWGSRSSGPIAFKTRGSLSIDDVSVRWRDSFDGGDVGVVWERR